MKRRWLFGVLTRVALWGGVFAALAWPSLSGTFARKASPRAGVRRARRVPADSSLVLATGYCNCGACCSWKRSWFGFGSPVYAYGSLKGKPKKVGVTASGTVARHGTIAADPAVWPFGTRLEIPGYGTGTVEDVGGAIKRRHVDLWFPTHAEARAWGVRWVRVRETGGTGCPERAGRNAKGTEPGR